MVKNTAQHQQELLSYLDTAYREIAAVEKAYGLAVGSGDLRHNIAWYQDTVMEVSRNPRAIPPERIAEDLAGLRAEADYARGGPHALLPEAGSEEADARVRKLKHQLLAGQITWDVPKEIIRRDVATFARRVMEWDEESLDLELSYRMADKPIFGRTGSPPRWVRMRATDFHREFDDAMEALTDARQERTLLSGLTETSISKAKGPRLRRMSALDVADQKLEVLWLLMSHPHNLGRTLALKTASSARFNAEKHLSEERWVELAAEARTLGEMYDRYALLYAATLDAIIEQNVVEKVEELDATVEELALIQQSVKEMEADTLSKEQLEQLVGENLEDKKDKEQVIANILRNMRKNQMYWKQEEIDKAILECMEEKDVEIEKLEKAHFAFLTNQLGIYEDARDLVKKLAAQGLNLAGQFVQAAAAMKGMRGKGR